MSDMWVSAALIRPLSLSALLMLHYRWLLLAERLVVRLRDVFCVHGATRGEQAHRPGTRKAHKLGHRMRSLADLVHNKMHCDLVLHGKTLQHYSSVNLDLVGAVMHVHKDRVLLGAGGSGVLMASCLSMAVCFGKMRCVADAALSLNSLNCFLSRSVLSFLSLIFFANASSASC